MYWFYDFSFVDFDVQSPDVVLDTKKCRAFTSRVKVVAARLIGSFLEDTVLPSSDLVIREMDIVQDNGITFSFPSPKMKYNMALITAMK
jgi:hypothetical protein